MSKPLLEQAKLLQAAPGGPRRPDARRVRPSAPKGWEPGVTYDPEKAQGTVTSEPIPHGEQPDWGGIFEHFGLSPDEFEIVGPVEMRSWEGWVKDDDGPLSTRFLYYYKARFQPRTAVENRQEIDDLVASIAKDKRKSKLATGDCALVVNIADWQTGKRDGDGTRGLILRAQSAMQDLRRRVVELRKLGVHVGTIYVAGVGDLVEGCDNHYAMQAFGVELNRRDQRKLARRLIKEIIKAASREVERVVVLAVGGNHGENRKDGKAFTDFGDNDDVAIFEEIAEALHENPEAYGHVEFVLPNDELTVTLDVCGTIITWAHGHQFRNGATPELKARNWLEKQALNKTAAGDCDLLVSGHFHHWRVAQWGCTGWVQAPALDGGSVWWRNLTGEHSPPGVLSFVAGRDVSAAGWGHPLMLGETYEEEA